LNLIGVLAEEFSSVDRFGQQSKSVKVLTLFGKDNQIDGIVLDVLLRKHKRIRSDGIGGAVACRPGQRTGTTPR